MLKLFVPNCYSLLVPVSRYCAKLKRRYFVFPDIWSIPYKKKLSWIQNQSWYWHETWISDQNWQEKKKNFEKINDDVILRKCDVSAIFPIYSQFGAIQKPDFGPTVCKTYIFINSNLLSYKNFKHNLKISNTSLTLVYWKKISFFSKKLGFLQSNIDISKIKIYLVVRKGILSETTYVCVLTCQIASFWHNSNESWTGVNFSPTSSPPQNEPLKSPPRLGLKQACLFFIKM